MVISSFTDAGAARLSPAMFVSCNEFTLSCLCRLEKNLFEHMKKIISKECVTYVRMGKLYSCI